MANWIALSAETQYVIRDENGVPVEWTLLKIGDNPLCQEGKDDNLSLTAEQMREIMEYHRKKGELIPLTRSIIFTSSPIRKNWMKVKH